VEYFLAPPLITSACIRARLAARICPIDSHWPAVLHAASALSHRRLPGDAAGLALQCQAQAASCK
jgi:hypothetical protein